MERRGGSRADVEFVVSQDNHDGNDNSNPGKKQVSDRMVDRTQATAGSATRVTALSELEPTQPTIESKCSSGANARRTPDLSSVGTLVVPWLGVDDVITLSRASKALQTAVQRANQFWDCVDFSSNCYPRCRDAVARLVNAPVSRGGRLIAGIKFSFSEDLDDSVLRLIPRFDAGDTQRFTCFVCSSMVDGPSSPYPSPPCSICSRERQGLQTLILNGCDAVDNETLKLVAERWPCLKWIELYWNIKITWQGLIPLLQSVGPSLQYLNLSGCKSVGDQAIGAVARYCNRNLVHLDLTRQLSMSGVGLLAVCERLHQLEYLNLYACHHLPPGSFKCISRLAKLKFLDLCGCLVTDDEIAAICAGCSYIESLGLTWCTKLTDHALVAVAGLGNSTQRRPKQLDDNHQQQQQQQELPRAGSTKQTPESRMESITGLKQASTAASPQCRDDTGPASHYEAPAGYAGLQVLSLHGNTKITKKGFQALIDSPHHRSIHSIDIRGCRPGLSEFLENRYERLKVVMPNVTVFNLHS